MMANGIGFHSSILLDTGPRRDILLPQPETLLIIHIIEIPSGMHGSRFAASHIVTICGTSVLDTSIRK